MAFAIFEWPKTYQPSVNGLETMAGRHFERKPRFSDACGTGGPGIIL